MIVHSTDGRIIGTLENGVFTKKVSGKKHMLQRPPAWCIDSEAFANHIRPNCNKIRIHDQDTGQTYEVSKDLFEEKKQFFNRGFGGQFMLLLKWWTVLPKGQKMLL